MVKKKRVPIVFEDDAVIVCEKPAGMPVQSDHTRDMDVLTILKHLRSKIVRKNHILPLFTVWTDQ